MDLALTTEQRALAEAAAGVLRRAWPDDRLAALADGTAARPTRADWQPLDDAGWLDPDLGPVELAVLAEAAGYALVPTSWADTLGAGRVLLAAAGERPRPVAVVGLLNPDEAAVRVTDAAGAVVLDGTLPRVPDTGDVDDLLVVVGDTVLVVAADAFAGRAAPGGVDLLGPAGPVELTATPARPLTLAGSTPEVLATARRHALTVLTAQAVGVATWALDQAVAHARTREQFGKAIGTYQGVAHQLAERYADIELARSALWYALACLQPDAAELVGPADITTAVDAAAALGARAAEQACETGVQVLGATGITWDHPIHLRYRRSLALTATLSGPADPWTHLTAGALDSESWTAGTA